MLALCCPATVSALVQSFETRAADIYCDGFFTCLAKEFFKSEGIIGKKTNMDMLEPKD